MKKIIFLIFTLFSLNANSFVVSGDLPTMEGGDITKQSDMDEFLSNIILRTNMILPRRLDYATILNSAEYLGEKTLLYNYILVGFNKDNEPRIKREALKLLKKEKEIFYCSMMEKTFFGDIGVNVIYRYHTEDMDETFTLYFYSEDCYK